MAIFNLLCCEDSVRQLSSLVLDLEQEKKRPGKDAGEAPKRLRQEACCVPEGDLELLKFQHRPALRFQECTPLPHQTALGLDLGPLAH